ncbi:L-histidine N(alpha)-methyltransferase [Pimelobacter simplex]|uniref:Dimethylhistidine N-methyltransferase n=1 Tax=Nocardioides simplex TaxID=2045 RepID=A0A0A1DSL9_NOCSI|nr:L-histidine N(alpha)-methyltransferase [Pimelobacter simplex]AIY19607.2 Dimethylhistidine N-methyltransferase [Pimelobacter simplex]MCG8150664.1 L-histidine N(alpha)-methyltransferase [Pimelobacter simplex]GEB15186.1 histidine N-alpha-methyltransferase [Pimelobacter simplex]SFM85329.1 L-histidine Nalpha-methyltransferase [Pimelobacter simplex]
MSHREPEVTVLLAPDWASGSLADDVRRGLTRHPRTLPPRWLYDDHGSALFDQITRLPEYYPFAAERAILETHADEIVTASGATSLIELGSGTSEKTRLLLDAFTRSGQLTRFAPVDVSEATLREAADQIAERYPDLEVAAVVGDFTLHLAQLPAGGRRMVAFLGGTIGNLYLEERRAFLGAVADVLEPGDSLLLGTDLVKSADRLIAAYDDAQGVTEEFVRNALVVVNRELGGDFDPAAFSYVPFWDPHMERMDLRLRAEVPQRVTIPGAELVLDLAVGEEIRIEISSKFRVSRIAAELEGAGLGVARVWTDAAGDFALTLAVKS